MGGGAAISKAARADAKSSPWSLTKGLGSIAKLGGALGKTAEKALEAGLKADDQKTVEMVEKHKDKLGPEGQKSLEALETSGKLAKRDSRGNTLRDQVDRYLEKGGDPEQVEALLKQLARPDENIRQLREETCVAANNMRDLAHQNPAEYFRMGSELADTGKTTLPNGETLELSEESQDFLQDVKDPAMRTAAAMQGALMEYANGSKEYNLEKDSSSTEIGIFGFDFNIGNEKGADIEAAQSLQDALGTAPTVDPRDLRDASEAKRYGKLSEAVTNAQQDGHSGVHIPMHSDGGKGEDKFHMMEIRKMEGDSVTLWDTETQKEVSMDKQDFLDNVGWDITAGDDIGGTRGRVAAAAYLDL